MSAGPIKQAREAWKPPIVSTPDAHRVCAFGYSDTAERSSHAYCGRTSSKCRDDWAEVTCADCHAARRADEAAS